MQSLVVRPACHQSTHGSWKQTANLQFRSTARNMGFFCQPFVAFCSFDTGTRVKISGETSVNTFFFFLLTCQDSEKRKSACIKVVVRSRWTIFFRRGKQQSRRVHNEGRCNHLKKYMVTFSFISVNRGCNQQLPPVTFGKVDLLAIAKWLLSRLFCVLTGLTVASL